MARYEWFIAKRFLREQRGNRFLSFITGFTILGITLGTAALIIALSILDGFEREIRDKVIGFTSHIQIEGFQHAPLRDPTLTMMKIREHLPEVAAVSPFVAREAMIRSRENVDGVLLKGIEPGTDLSLARTLLVEGTYLGVTTADSLPQLVMGRKLANKLVVGVGEKVVLFGLPQGAGEGVQPRAMQFTIVGIYESGMAEYDDIYVYTRIPNAQKFFQLGEAVSGYELILNDLSRAGAVADSLQGLLGYPHYARTVFQNYRNLFSWVELQKEMSPVLLSLIMLVAVVNIIGTLLMFVMEKTRSIAILNSLGAGVRGIQRIFMYQGINIASTGILLGNLLSFILCWIQAEFAVLSIPSEVYYMNTVPIDLNVMNFIIVTLGALVLCFLTMILPARSAARIDTVTALQFT